MLQGGGFKINRPFPTRALDQFDPWLMLDEMGPIDYKPGEALGKAALMRTWCDIFSALKSFRVMAVSRISSPPASLGKFFEREKYDEAH